MRTRLGKSTFSRGTAAAAALAAVLGATAGGARATTQPPARSASTPDPVEFERAAGAPRAADALAAGPRTGLVRTGRHFNVFGLRWRGASLASLRVQVRSGGRWHGWTRVPVEPDDGPDRGSREAGSGWHHSAPVWAGDARAVRFAARARGPVRGLRFHFVNTEGTATAAQRRHAVASRTAARAARPFVPAPGAPPIVTRDEWGASKCPPRVTPSYGEVDLAFVHHTVSANDYGPGDSAAMVLGICLYHRNSNGWNDIGYNFLVDRYGQVFEGRAGGMESPVVGAQAQGYNSVSTGIANLGTFSTAGQTAAGLQALARLLSWKLAVHGVPPTGTVHVTSTGGATNKYPAGRTVTFQRISGHRDADATSCPGDALYAQLPQLRGMVVPGPITGATKVTLGAGSLHIGYGSKVRLTAALAGPAAEPLGGRPLELQVLGGFGGWRLLQRLTTGPGGDAVTSLPFSYNHAIRVRYAGEPGLRPTQSKPLAIGVRPHVSAHLSTSSAAVMRRGARVRVFGRVRPHKRAAVLLVDRISMSGARRRVARRLVRVRKSRARSSIVLSRRGRYTLRLAVPADTRNLAARSGPIAVRVR